MRLFHWLLASSVLLVSNTVYAQLPTTMGAAVPPDRAALDRLNLKTDWLAYIPIEGRQDGITRVQLIDDSQVFVQTKSGVLVALDAFTGRMLWKFKLPSSYASGFPIGHNDKYVFVLNVAKLFMLDRYKGTPELEFDLPQSPSSGPVADSENFFLSLTGSAVKGYRIPRSLLSDPQLADKNAGDLAGVKGAASAKDRAASPSDIIADRFGARMYVPTKEPEFDRPTIPKAYLEGGSHLSPSQRTPSMTSLPTVVPPYTLGNLNKVESLHALRTLRKPYTLYPPHLQYNQSTPSIQLLPNLTRLMESSSLRVPPVKPDALWTFGTKQKVLSEPILIRDTAMEGQALWLVEDGEQFVMLSVMGQAQCEGRFEVKPVSGLAGPYAYDKKPMMGFVALNDGRLMAIDMIGSKGEEPRYEWKAKVGGFLNHKPIGALDGVYASGEHSGVARVNIETGEVDWRTDENSDTVLAINDEHVYIRDRNGNLQIYEKGKVHDRATRKSRPLATLPIRDFNIPFTNDRTDRLILVAESGLVISIRDSAAKYAKPKIITPAMTLPVVPKTPQQKPGEPVPMPGAPDAPKN